MKIFVAASSTFDDRKMFEKEILPLFKENPFKFDLDFPPKLFCKGKSQISDWVSDLKIPYTEVTYLSVPTDLDQVILFWDGESKGVEILVNMYPNAKVIRFDNKYVNSFKAEIDKIHNDKWREGCQKLAEVLPNYFWVVPASSSGKFHPTCSLGPGGLLRHSIMVSVIGADLLENETFIEKTELNEDKVRVACLFHDCMKQGRDGCEGHTVFEHPILAAEFMEEHLKDYIDEENLQEILGAVRTHMGKWTTSKYSSKTLEKPTTMFQKLVHNADYVASRKFIGGLTEWSQEENA